MSNLGPSSFSTSGTEFHLGTTCGKSAILSILAEHAPILRQAPGLSLHEPGNAQDDIDIDEEPEVQQALKQFPFHGNFVLELPVPPSLYSRVVPVFDSLRDRNLKMQRNEFSHMRYSAVTCDPSDFASSKFTLRQPLFTQPRQTEVCIAITMYNEDDYLLGQTLRTVHKNIAYLQRRSADEVWGPDSWRKVVVCIVSDGRAKMNPRTKALLACLGIYQDFAALQNYNGIDVVAHMYEYTTRAAIKSQAGKVSVDPGATEAVPCQTILCVKEKNQKKINSHRWFLTACCEVLRPKVCVLVDAGVTLSSNAIYELWKPLDADAKIAASTGFTSVETLHGKKTLNPLVAFQVFEYQMTNSLERPVESLIGHRFNINKGGLCAYRFSAIHDSRPGEGMFGEYYRAERMAYGIPNLAKANALLTEDRAIAWGLLTGDQSIWRTVSVDSARAETDVPDTWPEFIMQRRRWINGDLFSTMNEFRHVHRLFLQRQKFGFARLTMFVFGYIYQLMRLILQFFSLGNLFAIFWVVLSALGHSQLMGAAGHRAALALAFLYALALVATLVVCLGNRTQGASSWYRWLSITWMTLALYFVIATIYLIVKNNNWVLAQDRSNHRQLYQGELFMMFVWPILITYGIWILAPLTLLRRPHQWLSLLWYLFILPVYWNVVNVYAFCNLHDISWGTKGSESALRLPSVFKRPKLIEAQADSSVVYHHLPADGRYLDEYYFEQKRSIASELVHKRSYEFVVEDGFRSFRTTFLLCWLALNGALVMTILNIPEVSILEVTSDGGKGYLYIGAVLWANAGITIFQFLFTLSYAIRKYAMGVYSFVLRRMRPRGPGA